MGRDRIRQLWWRISVCIETARFKWIPFHTEILHCKYQFMPYAEMVVKISSFNCWVVKSFISFLIRRERIFALGYSCSIISVLFCFQNFHLVTMVCGYQETPSKSCLFLFCDVYASCWNSGWTGHFLCHKAMTVNLLLHWIGLRLWRKSGDTFKPFPYLFKVDRLYLLKNISVW